VWLAVADSSRFLRRKARRKQKRQMVRRIRGMVSQREEVGSSGTVRFLHIYYLSSSQSASVNLPSPFSPLNSYPHVLLPYLTAVSRSGSVSSLL